MSNPIADLLKTLDPEWTSGRRFRRHKRKLRALGSVSALNSWTWDFADENPCSMMMKENDMSDKIFLGVSDFDDLITSKVLQTRVDNGKQTIHRETTVLANRQTWSSWMEKEFAGYLFVEGSASSGFIVDEVENNFVKYSVNSNSTTVRAFGDEMFSERIMDVVESKFDVVTSYVEWIYGSDGASVNVPLNRDRLPCAEMYPFLNGETLESYYDRYMESSANILLLIGPPGTGKTTFIRGLLAHRDASAMVTYDAGILEKDGFFARFIEDDTSVMVLEDSDAFLKSRSDGNTMMHRFLNVGDGLVTTKGKKMIFSTNLPSIRDIDSALVRPGRCFDIVEFKSLSADQAKTLADKLGGRIDAAKSEHSIAEIFNTQTHKPTARKVGFI
jgi:hypothetical protein